MRIPSLLFDLLALTRNGKLRWQRVENYSSVFTVALGDWRIDLRADRVDVLLDRPVHGLHRVISPGFDEDRRVVESVIADLYQMAEFQAGEEVSLNDLLRGLENAHLADEPE